MKSSLNSLSWVQSSQSPYPSLLDHPHSVGIARFERGTFRKSLAVSASLLDQLRHGPAHHQDHHHKPNSDHCKHQSWTLTDPVVVFSLVAKDLGKVMVVVMLLIQVVKVKKCCFWILFVLCSWLFGVLCQLFCWNFPPKLQRPSNFLRLGREHSQGHHWPQSWTQNRDPQKECR